MELTCCGSNKKLYLIINTAILIEFQCVMRPLRGKAVLGAVENTTMPIGSRQSVEDCNTECKRSATCHGVLYDINQQGDRVCTIVRESIIVQDNGCCDLYIKTCPGETRLESKFCIRIDIHHSYRIYDSTGQWML